MVERLKLGALGGDGEPQHADEFGRVTGVVAGADGALYVADALAREVRVFSAEGAAVRSIGRPGDGPGEFASIQSLGMLGDTLAVLDPFNGRISLFSTDGEWLGQRPYARVGGPDIRIFQTRSDEFSVPTVQGQMELVYVRHTASGPHESTPMRVGTLENFYVYCRGAGAFLYFYPEWAPSALRIPAPGGQAVEAWGGRYHVSVVEPGGDTVRVIERDYEPRAPTEAEWREQVAMFDSMMAPLVDRQCEPNRPVRPAEMGLIRTMFFDDSGRLWVERRASGGFLLDAFDHEGRLRGSVALPDRVLEVPIFIRGSHVYLVVEGDLDVHQVVVYEVDALDGGP
jgi:hypothetical protein